MTKCITLFSGGLDSVIAIHLLQQQGIEVEALHFVLPFDQANQNKLSVISRSAEALGVSLHIEEDGDEFLSMLKNPIFGFGKHANPCIDCRIRRLVRAKKYLDQRQADFIATGEVVGQRPMSQRRDRLYVIAKQAGLEGYVLRPLSAGLLFPTVSELNGLVDRNKLFSIQGRCRKTQLEYAATYGLSYLPPAGGCLLTFDSAVERIRDLSLYNSEYTLNDLRLISIGRHFRISKKLLLIVARDEAENILLESMLLPIDYRLEIVGMSGPLCCARGTVEKDGDIILCCRILARYCRAAREHAQSKVKVTWHNQTAIYDISSLPPDKCDPWRVGQ